MTDKEKFNYHRVKNYPTSMPFFFNRLGDTVKITDLYAGGHAFLIAGGPSFNEVDKSKLKFCYTMCMNNSVKSCMPHFRPNAWTCVDSPNKFLYTMWQDPLVMKFAPRHHLNKPLWNNDKKQPEEIQVKDCPNVLFCELSEGFKAEKYLFEDTFNWGNNSKVCRCGWKKKKKKKCPNCGKDAVFGKRSVMLLAIKILFLLGFRHVYLLGVDFNMTEDKGYSFDQKCTSGTVSGNTSTYKELNWRFGQLNPIFKECGFNVYNCNPESKLEAFEFLKYDEAIKKTLGFVDDVKLYMSGNLENTDNLYNTKWFVCGGCQRNLRLVKKEVKRDGYTCECGFILNKENYKKYRKKVDG